LTWFPCRCIFCACHWPIPDRHPCTLRRSPSVLWPHWTGRPSCPVYFYRWVRIAKRMELHAWLGLV